MKSIKHLIVGLLAGGFLLATTVGNVSAQTDLFTGEPAGASARSDWSQRVLRRERSAGSPVRTAAVSPWERQFRQVADEEPMPDDAYDADGLGVDITDSPGMVPPRAASQYPTYSDLGDSCGQCDSYCEDYGQCGPGCGGGCAGYGHGWPGGHGRHGMMRPGWHRGWWLRDLSLFAGVHGFKGPLDQGQNGNFGFQEGANIGVPLGIAAVGFQAGVVAVQSNFEGDSIGNGHRGDHDQIFFTTGLFRRALCGGFQWGVVFDLMRDSYYYGSSDLKQLRTEAGYVMAGGRREIGYLGAYGLGKDQLPVGQQLAGWLDPTDMFAVYYRRYFEGGGDGRFWAGCTGRGDGLLGADLRVPIGGAWAIENRVNYLIPREGRDEGGQEQESWGLTVQLVWYLGQPARCVRNSPFRPMMNVADNSLFMVDRLQ